MSQHVLVTGGAGLLDHTTVDLLLKQGKQVTVFDNLAGGKREYLPLQHPRLIFLEEDILDYEACCAAVKHCDAVLHLAALSSVPKSIENPLQSFRVNTQGFLHVLQAVRAVNRPIRLVYASSAAVYGGTSSLPCDDDLPFHPLLLSPTH